MQTTTAHASACEATQAHAGLAPGHRVGDYAITKQIGAGGMATVYEGAARGSGRRVAIKVLNAEWRETDEAILRFFQEARVLSSLRHPHLVELHASGYTDDGRPYLVTTLVEDGSLRQHLDRGLAVPDRFTVLLQVAHALAAAHRAEVIHRDIKPENILIERLAWGAPRARLVDFGAAKLRESGEDWQPSTAMGRLVGTLRYMAPEQFCEGPVDQRVDLYALGLVMYEAFTGAWPWPAGGDGHLVLCHTVYPPSSDAELDGHQPALSQLIMECLAKAPQERPESAMAVASRLTRVRDACQHPDRRFGTRRPARERQDRF